MGKKREELVFRDHFRIEATVRKVCPVEGKDAFRVLLEGKKRFRKKILYFYGTPEEKGIEEGMTLVLSRIVYSNDCWHFLRVADKADNIVVSEYESVKDYMETMKKLSSPDSQEKDEQ